MRTSQRIRDRINRMEPLHRIVNGEFIDQFTTAIDNRTDEEILARIPKCMQRKDKNENDKIQRQT